MQHCEGRRSTIKRQTKIDLYSEKTLIIVKTFLLYLYPTRERLK